MDNYGNKCYRQSLSVAVKEKHSQWFVILLTSICSVTVDLWYSVLCTIEDCSVLQSLWNTTIAPLWQFKDCCTNTTLLTYLLVVFFQRRTVGVVLEVWLRVRSLHREGCWQRHVRVVSIVTQLSVNVLPATLMTTVKRQSKITSGCDIVWMLVQGWQGVQEVTSVQLWNRMIQLDKPTRLLLLRSDRMWQVGLWREAEADLAKWVHCTVSCHVEYLVLSLHVQNEKYLV